MEKQKRAVELYLKQAGAFRHAVTIGSKAKAHSKGKKLI